MNDFADSARADIKRHKADYMAELEELLGHIRAGELARVSSPELAGTLSRFLAAHSVLKQGRIAADLLELALHEEIRELRLAFPAGPSEKPRLAPLYDEFFQPGATSDEGDSSDAP